MAFLTLEIEDAVLERITDIAAERGEDKMRVAVQVLNEAFKPTGEDKIGADSNEKTFGQSIIEVLEPFWAEQIAHPERFQPGLTPENAGDHIEAYLAEHWANDIRNPSKDRE